MTESAAGAVLRPVDHSDPAVSVVVPTIPRNDHDAVVEHLREQTGGAYEVIVVDDATLDICEARNAGIRAARGDIVALTDDDCRPSRDWLAGITDAFDRDSQLVCLEGAVRGGRTYDGERMYVGCNLAFDREAALAAGGFRSAFAGWRDDTEFGWRMERDADGRCTYRDDVEMYHPDQPRATIDEVLEARLRREYPERYEDVIVPDTLSGRVNDWLWRKGFWNVMDTLRYDLPSVIRSDR
ncbi:glycosyltransferase family 2 protein [Natrinema halophilum]|uniref:Glycosyltransferase family 2 protein n=1 Tax=Natrinema halophilum TaxID=1699371 RepID=A0A7D5GKP5_9EURY|nr:glycosyltransferase family A protein [Natrinema halophilum]QLG48852.1 glycosyltransferase family 2 protein [Natrinema halophilum]